MDFLAAVTVCGAAFYVYQALTRGAQIRLQCVIMASDAQSAPTDVLTYRELKDCSYWELWAIAKQYRVALPEGTRKK